MGGSSKAQLHKCAITCTHHTAVASPSSQYQIAVYGRWLHVTEVWGMCWRDAEAVPCGGRGRQACGVPADRHPDQQGELPGGREQPAEQRGGGRHVRPGRQGAHHWQHQGVAPHTRRTHHQGANPLGPRSSPQATSLHTPTWLLLLHDSSPYMAPA